MTSTHAGRFERTAVAAGVAALVAGAQLFALLAVVSLRPAMAPAEMYRPWFAATALLASGLVLASAGSLRGRVLVAILRRRTPPITAAVVAGGLAFWGLAVWGTPPGGPADRFATFGVPLSQLALVGLWALWARPTPAESVPRLDRRTGANLLIVVFLALSAITTGLRMPDIYPFSEYTMYSHARLDPYTLQRVVFEAAADDGTTGLLPAPATRQALLSLVRSGDDDRIDAFARRVAGTHDVPMVTVYVEVIGVAEHPEPPSLEVRERREVTTVER